MKHTGTIYYIQVLDYIICLWKQRNASHTHAHTRAPAHFTTVFTTIYRKLVTLESFVKLK